MKVSNPPQEKVCCQQIKVVHILARLQSGSLSSLLQ
jgi:hypothetical protein